MMSKLSVLVLGLLYFVGNVACGYTDSEENDYNKYKVINIIPHNEAQAEVLRHFSDDTGMVEVLKPSRAINDSLDLLVHPSIADQLLQYTKSRNFDVNVKYTDFRRSLAVDSFRQSRRSSSGEFNVLGYNSNQQIMDYQKKLAELYPECVTAKKVGSSFEGRSMYLTSIKSKSASSPPPAIFIDAGIHAREWVAPAMAMYLIDRLAKSCNDDQDSVLNGVEWLILPITNPDGYEFSRTKNRMWRKTRSKYVKTCHGVDGNRNYGFKWGGQGISRNPCDIQTYAGPQPFSEKETRIVRDIMLQNKDRIKLYVSLHSYGNYLVYPWGYTGEVLPKRWKELHSLGESVSKAIASAGGGTFTVKSAGQWYPAAGGSDDYAFATARIPFSYTMELTSGYEFIYPENLLGSVLPKYYEGFKVFKKFIAETYGSH